MYRVDNPADRAAARSVAIRPVRHRYLGIPLSDGRRVFPYRQPPVSRHSGSRYHARAGRRARIRGPERPSIALLTEEIRLSPHLWQAFQYRGELLLARTRRGSAAGFFRGDPAGSQRGSLIALRGDAYGLLGDEEASRRDYARGFCLAKLRPLPEIATLPIRVGWINNDIARMQRDNRAAIETRVVQAAEAALADHGYVSLIDLFTGMRLLLPVHVESWRKGRIEFLEPMIQGSPQKDRVLPVACSCNGRATEGLQPSETALHATRDATVRWICDSPWAEIRRSRKPVARILFPTLSSANSRSWKKIGQAPRPVVFEILRDSECTECGVELPAAACYSWKPKKPLCLACAGMGRPRNTFLPATWR